MACRLPGGIDSPAALWQALLRGDDLVTEVPAHRWDVEEFYDPEPGVPGRTVCKWGAFLDDIAEFDPEFFGISEREATEMDPQHRLLLQTAWEAMEHAGLTRKELAGVRTGVFVGLMHDDYLFMHADADTLSGPYGYMGNSFAMGSGRVSYAMGLSGPAMTVDTACSSGLSAIHLACRSLHDGESDMVLTGGAAVSLEPRKAASGSAIGMLSATGHCHAFDVNADGFVSGEGAVMLLLKRLEDAQRDGDQILAVIRGTAANQDGHTVNIVTPSQPAQVAAYRAALSAADVDPTTVGMVEAHGTGTPVGDPIEYASLAEIYGTEGPCALASVKTNFGHTQAAAGALGLMKAVLALQHGVVPQNLHFSRLPEKLTEIETNLFVPQESTVWPIGDASTPRRAAVSSYGFSGTNVHAVLEQAPEQDVTPEPPTGAAGVPGVPEPAGAGLHGELVFPVSASSEEALRTTAEQLAGWVEAQADLDVADLAYTLARRRSPRAVRGVVFAEDRPQLAGALRELAGAEVAYPPAVGLDDKGPVWVFSGQGSQWAQMGKDLLEYEPVFAATIAEIEPLIAEESGFSVTEALTAAEKVSGIDRVQPTLFAMQVGLAAAMKAYGVIPGAVIGHSLGESAAAVVAGALSVSDGVKVICRRSKLMTRIAGAGAMASVELPAQQVFSELLGGGITDATVAVVASPQSTVIGGDTATVRELVAAWEQRDVLAREVAVDVASHSPQVDPILDDLTEALADIGGQEPAVPYYSATSFDPREEPYFDAYYWADNLRHTVRFAAAVQAALEDGFRVFTELSPHPLLTHAVDQTARGLDMSVAALAAMRREQPLPHGLRGLLGDLYAAGAAVDFSVLYPTGRLVDAILPAWNHRRLMLVESTDRLAHANSVAVHPLLGPHVRLPEEPERHVWQADIGTQAQPWLEDHQIHGAPALPGAAYCEMALSAAHTILGEAGEVRDIEFEQLLLLDAETLVGTTATVESPGMIPFTVETTEDGERTLRATAILHALTTQEAAAEPPAPHDIEALLAGRQTRIDGDDLRLDADLRGIQYGPAFAGLVAAHTAEEQDTLVAEAGLPVSIRSQQTSYVIHPALLDACFQSVAAHPSVRNPDGSGAGRLLLPLGVGRIRSYGPARHAHYCLTTVTRPDSGAGELSADIDVLDEHGAVLLAVRGLRLGTGASADSEHDRVLSERLLTIEWQEHELPDTTVTEPGNWLLINVCDTAATADSADTAPPLASSLAEALATHDAQTAAMSWPLDGDHGAEVGQLRDLLNANVFDGVVILTEPPSGRDGDAISRGAQYVELAVHIARELPEIVGQAPRFYVVTHNAAPVLPGDCPNLEQGGLRGLLRVISSEHPHLKPTGIDIDDTSAEHLARQLLQATDEDETAWRDGQWYAARLYPSALRPEERRSTVVDHSQQGMRVQVRTPGDLQTLEFTAFDRKPPGPNEIEVAVASASINFADVLAAYGRCPTFDGKQPPLGLDFAGVVTAVGSDVSDHKIGDRVGGLSPDGCWATFVTCDARLATVLPEGLTDVEAAAVSTASATAWYGLQDLARIRAGDKVLIHSGTGGVGQAAIAIARAAGAQIYATAGSDKRRQV
ncbi:sulfolipid-1 biosynthesis phthioceranic/hydroxyphthioceranic acid synthase, partial [Mycobacterium sp.]|uniref:sulfolipid-1 biosynthesis phthioceranic/hydroxyphthioceranic acid synthase n=1 Tax=Mycobacterium sp. TaxID=1785 RepID=UPI003A8585EF